MYCHTSFGSPLKYTICPGKNWGNCLKRSRILITWFMQFPPKVASKMSLLLPLDGNSIIFSRWMTWASGNNISVRCSACALWPHQYTLSKGATLSPTMGCAKGCAANLLVLLLCEVILLDDVGRRESESIANQLFCVKTQLAKMINATTRGARVDPLFIARSSLRNSALLMGIIVGRSES